jgi:PIN domain nuclease of toxin-antitoxin system
MSTGLRYVLDTHAALWAQLEPMRLGRTARATLSNLSPAALAVSDVTLTEVARLLKDGKVVPGAAAPMSWLEAFGLCFNVRPVTPRIAWLAAAFDWPHRDPCDRHILATAVVHGLPLMTIDPLMTAFAPSVGVKVVW